MAKKETKTQAENMPKGKVTYPLGKMNFILMAICLFETSRVTTGPIIALLGFVLMAFAIIFRKKDNTNTNEQQDNETPTT